MPLEQILSRIIATSSVVYVSEDEFAKIKGRKGTSARGVSQKVTEDGRIYRVRGEDVGGQGSKLSIRRKLTQSKNGLDGIKAKISRMDDKIRRCESAEERQNLVLQRAKLRDELLKHKEELVRLGRLLK